MFDFPASGLMIIITPGRRDSGISPSQEKGEEKISQESVKDCDGTMGIQRCTGARPREHGPVQESA